MAADPRIDGEIPGLCGCGHDDAYHYRPVFGRAADDSMVMIGQRGCTTCLCPGFDTKRIKGFLGTGANAPKDWGNR